MKKAASLLLCAVISLGLLSGCGDRAEHFMIYETFDTVIDVIVYTGSADAEKYGQMAKTELLRYHRLFDAYHPYAGAGGIYAVNHADGNWVEVEDEVIDVLRFGLDAYQKTGGAVNLLGGAVTTLWKDTEVPPDAATLAEAMRHTDIKSLEINGSKVRLTDPKAGIDVGAFAKGYALEQTAARLKQNGFCGILSATSSIVTVGDKNGIPFAVAIGDPAGGAPEMLAMRGMSLSTSGTDQRYFEYEGKRYHHIIDLSTGYPAESGVIQASIIDGSAAWCDVYSTAALITGKTEQDGLLYFQNGDPQFTGEGEKWKQ